MCDERNTNESADVGPRSYALRMYRAEWPEARLIRVLIGTAGGGLVKDLLALRGPSTPRGFQYLLEDGRVIDPREEADVIEAYHAVEHVGRRVW